jgi:hypothetical protein
MEEASENRTVVHSQIADGDHLQIWRVVTNIPNMKLWTADKRCFSILGLGEGLTTQH